MVLIDELLCVLVTASFMHNFFIRERPKKRTLTKGDVLSQLLLVAVSVRLGMALAHYLAR